MNEIFTSQGVGSRVHFLIIRLNPLLFNRLDWLRAPAFHQFVPAFASFIARRTTGKENPSELKELVTVVALTSAMVSSSYWLCLCLRQWNEFYSRSLFGILTQLANRRCLSHIWFVNRLFPNDGGCSFLINSFSFFSCVCGNLSLSLLKSWGHTVLYVLSTSEWISWS